MDSPSGCYGSGKKKSSWVSSAAECRRGSTVLGRFSLLASAQPEKSVMGAALDSPGSTPDHSGKGGKNETVDFPGHGKEDKVRVAEGLHGGELESQAAVHKTRQERCHVTHQAMPELGTWMLGPL